MRWQLAPDEAMIIEFQSYDGFWMFTNMGTFWNSMDYLYRPVSYTPSRTAVDSDGKVRIVMTHEDPGYFNWLDTQSFTHGFLRHSSVLSRTSPMLETKLVKANELAGHLPADVMRGAKPPKPAPEFHAYYGDRDPAYSGVGRQTLDTLKKVGFPPDVRVLRGVGHDFDAAAPEILDCLERGARKQALAKN